MSGYSDTEGQPGVTTEIVSGETDESASDTTDSEESSESDDEAEEDIESTSAFEDGADTPYQQTESECNRENCDGTLWYRDNVLVCQACSSTVGLDQRRRKQLLDDPWDVFWNSRDEYFDSGSVKLVGGYLEAYDWVQSDDVDGAVGDINPGSFYR